MRRFLLLLCVFSVLAFIPDFIAAQRSAVAPRITAPIDESALTTLRGGVPGRARAEFDQGRAPASATLSSVRLVLSRTPQQEAALEKFMAEQLDPASPNYHKWLTPQQFGQLYGPADADITTLVTWLESHGFTVRPVAPGRTSIAFSGTVAQMEAVFHTEIHSFNDHGEQFLSNVSNPQIPSALAAVVSGVAQMDTIKPKPTSIRGQSGTFDTESKRLRPMLTIGSGTSTSPYDLFLVPGDAATIYDTPNSANANFPISASSSYNGVGVTIGIGGDATIQTSTVENYRQKFIGDSNVPTITNVTSDPATCTDATSTSCAQDEAYLDNEIAGGLAPGATIHFYTSASLSDAIEQAISDNTVDIFSLSFGECEADMSTADNQAINGWWQQAAAQGIAVTVSTGDSGSAGCDDDNTEYSAVDGLQVSGFASTPYNIAVGGTDFAGLTNSFTAYVSTTSTNSYYRSALEYIPESTWNDSVTSDGLLAEDTAYVDASTDKTNIVAGSGGASSCSTNSNTSTTLTNCTSGYAKPTWQTGTGVPADGVRDIPDVSLMAGNGFDDAAWLVCTDDTATSGTTTITTNCSANSSGEFYFSGFGGTSTSAPAFAGILALVQQMAGSRLGMAALNLYRLFNGPNASAIFHDTTEGNNSVPCVSGTPNCSQNTAGNYFLSGYNTGAGYDLATGLGSVDATQLIQYWKTATGSVMPTLTLTSSLSTITTSQPESITVTISGSSGTPTGTASLSGGGYSTAALTLGNGGATFNINPGLLAVGSDVLTITYSGDNTYSSSSATITVTVTLSTPTVTVTPAATTITANTALSVKTTIIGGSVTPASGTVILSGGGYTSSAQTLSNGAYTFSIPSNSLSVGTDTLSVAYSGDSIYSAGQGTATVTVAAAPTPLTPVITVSPASTSIDSAQSLSVPVTVTGTGATPTGTVTLSGGGYTSTAQTLSVGAYTFVIPANTLASGTDTLTTSYSGDGVYAAASGSASVSVTQTTYLLSPTTPSAISPGGNGSSTITVSTNSGYSGSVTLACSLTSSPTGAVAAYNPTCSVSGSPITLSSSAASGTATVSFSTTAASAAVAGHIAGANWFKSGAATLAAMFVFFGIPRRRRWRAMLGIVVLMVVFGALSACGGSSDGSGSGSGGNSNPGTTAGTYTFTITGTGNPAVSPSPSTTVTLTVN